MIKFVVDGQEQCRFIVDPVESRKDKITIGSSDSSDVFLEGIDRKHLTIHVKQSNFEVQIHSEHGFGYGLHYFFPKSARFKDKPAVVQVGYGETFKIDHILDNKTYVIQVEEC
jgi:hypothetical protein